MEEETTVQQSWFKWPSFNYFSCRFIMYHEMVKMMMVTCDDDVDDDD